MKGYKFWYPPEGGVRWACETWPDRGVGWHSHGREHTLAEAEAAAQEHKEWYDEQRDQT